MTGTRPVHNPLPNTRLTPCAQHRLQARLDTVLPACLNVSYPYCLLHSLNKSCFSKTVMTLCSQTAPTLLLHPQSRAHTTISPNPQPGAQTAISLCPHPGAHVMSSCWRCCPYGALLSGTAIQLHMRLPRASRGYYNAASLNFSSLPARQQQAWL